MEEEIFKIKVLRKTGTIFNFKKFDCEEKIRLCQPYYKLNSMDKELSEVKNLATTETIETNFEDLKKFILFIERQKIAEAV